MNNQELARKLRNNPIFYIEKNLYIRTKEGKLQKLKINYVQTELINYVIECLDKGVPIRVIILKARQEGMSTIIEAIIFWYTATHKNRSGRIVAHDGDSSNNLFNMSKLYYERLHEFVRPMIRYSNRKELVFENPDDEKRSDNPGLGSKMMVSTAGNLQAGRSETNQLIHASEVAFWDHPEELMAGLMQTVPYSPNTMIFLESTANGVGGYFYNEYQRAKRGKSVFKCFFFPWFVHEEYHLKPPIGFKPNRTEQKLKTKYGLTNAQLYWRRVKKSELESTGGKFEQEYPSDDYEAFIASGRPRFDVDQLMKYRLETKKPVRGYLKEGKFTESDSGSFRVWKLPFWSSAYAIGVDVAEGLEIGDNSVVQVLDKFMGEQVAEWAGKCDPDELGYIAVEIAKFYNFGLLGIEANNHGLTTLTIAKQENYPNIYYRRVLDDRTHKKTNKFGWHTNVKTKPLAIDEMAVWIRERQLIINSQELVEECLTYVIDENGRTNAQEGALDDRVMSMAIAIQMLKHVTRYEEKDPIIRFRKG